MRTKRNQFSAIPGVTDDPFMFFGYYVPPSLATHVKEGDELIRMGFHDDRFSNRTIYFRKALQCCLRGMIDYDAFQNTARYGSRAEDRVLLLMVILGGGAQLLLDWLSFTASAADTDRESDDSKEAPPSAESETKTRHPLFALHGVFDKDTNEEATSLVNLYLLASCRSLADHRRKKNCFLAYQSAVRRGADLIVVPQKIEAMNGNIASFLWGPAEYEYGESLPEEILCTVRHIKENKKGGLSFLKQVLDASTNFSPREAPGLLSNKSAPVFHLAGASDGSHHVAPVTNIPELWLLYQECFCNMKPDLNLNEFLQEEEVKLQADKTKMD